MIEYEEGASLESVWATPVEKNYRVENIPFYATLIAYGDIISTREGGEELLFDALIEASGHGVVQLMLLDEKAVNRVAL